MLAAELKLFFHPGTRIVPIIFDKIESWTPEVEALEPEQLAPKLLEYKDRIHQLETCYKITSLLNSELNKNLLLDTIMRIAKKVMKADASSLLLIDEERGDLVFQVALSRVGTRLKDMTRLKLGEGIAGAVAQSGRPMILRDAYKSRKFNPDYDKKTGFKTGSVLCAPLKTRGRIIGVCQVIHRRNTGKVFTKKELALFRLFCDSAALAIHNSETHHLLMEKQRLGKDMEFAQNVQESFLPQTVPEHPNFTFAAFSLPAQNVGGDYYDFIPLDASRLVLLLGDVSGKGVSAALQMARLMSDFKYVSLKQQDPGRVLEEINRILCERSYRGMFTTALYVVLDLKLRKMHIGNAGHPPILLQRGGGRVQEVGGAMGPPLGVLPEARYGQETLDLEPGDGCVLLSDGILEAKNEEGELFGLRRLLKFLEQGPTDPRQILKLMEQRLHTFSGAAPQNDDQTTIAFQVR